MSLQIPKKPLSLLPPDTACERSFIKAPYYEKYLWSIIAAYNPKDVCELTCILHASLENVVLQESAINYLKNRLVSYDEPLNDYKKGYLHTVRFSLLYRQLGDSCRGDLLIEASERGDLTTVEAALSQGDIIDQRLGLALDKAAQKGHLAIVKKIWAKVGKRISIYHGGAASQASRNGHWDVVKELLSYGPIHQSQSSWVMLDACKRGLLEIVKKLFAQEKVTVRDPDRIYRMEIREGGISRALHFGDAVCIATEYGHLEIVAELLAHGKLNEEDYARAFSLAQKHGHPAIRQLLEDSAK